MPLLSDWPPHIHLSAILDEVALDPTVAAKTLIDTGITHTVVRFAWGLDVLDLLDEGNQKLKSILSGAGLSVVALYAQQHNQHQPQIQSLVDYYETIDRAILLTLFYGATYLQVGLNGLEFNSDPDKLNSILSTISSKCLTSNVVPIVKLHNAVPISTARVLAQLHTHQRWRFIYNTGHQFLISNPNAFLNDWVLSKSRVGILELQDAKCGRGPCLYGQGDAKIDLVLSDILTSGRNTQLCLYPGLARPPETRVAAFIESCQKLQTIMARLI